MALDPSVYSTLQKLVESTVDPAGASHERRLPPDATPQRIILQLRGADPARVTELSLHSDTALAAIARRAMELQLRLDATLEENRELRQMAHRDELTGLENRRGFRARLEFALSYASRYGGAVSVLLADLDGLKRVNDTHGHPTGDAVLRSFGKLLAGSVRNTDLAARLGGDEFGVVMPHTDAAAAAVVAERIRRHAEGMEAGNDSRCPLSASIGVATAEPSARGEIAELERIFAEADSALYSAKRGGRNRVEMAGLLYVAA